jgi:hypothetical protein
MPPADATATSAVPPRVIDLLCLCAAWCRLCEGYRAVFDALAAEPAPLGVALRWRWIDIEDEADLVGDLDIETFPTWVIAEGTVLLFAGALTPEPATVRRVLGACLGGKPMPLTGEAAEQRAALQAVLAGLGDGR